LRCVRYGNDDVALLVVGCAHDDAVSPGGRHDPHGWPDGIATAMAARRRSLRRAR